MVEASALWLAPGLEHPVYARFAAFFGTLFRRFEALDYRALYLAEGASALEERVRAAASGRQLVIYSQFPSSYSYLRPEFLRSLESTVVGLGFDDEIYFEQAKYFYQACAAVITSDMAGAEWLRQAGIPAYLAQLQQPLPEQAYVAMPEDIDVSFVGDMSKPGRREYVQHLESRGIAVADYGAGSRRGRVSDAQVLEIFRRSRINLNFTSINPPAWILRHDPLRGRFGQIKGRPFELAAMGRFCLCEWAGCVEHWFRPGVEIGVFRDAEDLEREVRRYLGDERLRTSVAAAAKARHGADLACEVQYARIFSSILAQPQRKRSVATAPGNPVFYESMGRSRGSAFLHALRRGSPLRAMGEPFNRFSGRLEYWRGFAGGVVGALAARL